MTTQRVDLEHLKEIVFKNIEVLLDSLGIEYTVGTDNHFCCCPVHAGSDNPTAVSISTENHHWLCWTRDCHEEWGKDIFGFVRGTLTNQLGREIKFYEALVHICHAYNLPMGKFGDEWDYTPVPKVEVPFVEQLVDPSPLSLFCPYFVNRGFNKETLRFFGVGDYAGKEFKLKYRAMIPVYNIHGQLVRYICRATKPYIKPKFIWSKKPFRKRQYLYNLHTALPFLKKLATAIMVEGTGDVWRLYEAGVDNAVCPFGKVIAEPQHKLLLDNGVRKLVVLMDDDQPGREAKFKIQRELGSIFDLIFPKICKKDIGKHTISEVHRLILPQIKGLY